MRFVVFDIETRSTTLNRGRIDPEQMELTVVGVYDSETDSYTSYFKDELHKLWPILERTDLLIGFNSDTFDIPILNRYYPGDLSKIRSLDLLTEVYKTLGRRIRLDSLAQATLGRGKSGDGLKAMVWWEEGKYDLVREYCVEDVRLTKELYDYMLKNGSVKYKDLRDKKEIKIDTSHWSKPSNAPAMTHALPL
ncbi:MAG TPA: ribonuclease H-like domain-containing protein [Candidatus Paceibacterota bacterium]|nr:ribonuclease H-like domain-containing protein [Candidatus Paceibacterota bacterium]